MDSSFNQNPRVNLKNYIYIYKQYKMKEKKSNKKFFNNRNYCI